MATWFPERTLEVSDLPELGELPAARREHALSLGIDTVRCAQGATETDLAERAAREALRRSGLDAADLDALLLVQGRAPQYLLASEATRLQHVLGAERAFVSGIGELGCVSVSAALRLAAALLRGDTHCRTVLVVAAARTPTRARYRSPMTILGDGAAAVLLTTDSADCRYELVDIAVRSDGRYSDLFRIDYRDVPSEHWIEECADEPTYSFRLAVESSKRFTALNAEVLARNGLSAADISAVLMQNLSVGSLAFWAEALERRIHPACAENLARYGHLGPVDVLINLDDAAATLAPGAAALLLNSSPVAAWSTAVLRRTDMRV
ncbi:3-oxoacyl-[acyl-carrier-protein] synthase III C-terminal domain-containing protein [Nocardia paucivorans]|uniref:3-oxoacyl-[acyl-carrier-protein] synthase III C-terminal domain-containing protein n=1 Tax=Nocardia paucivorans TaxID=114259 RepID=UPI0009FFF8E1|nr:3-oxoacyl-[acyl-carrier-protein] synthase III C-terminal domain-containing protein [Nocardia paucivorans]